MTTTNNLYDEVVTITYSYLGPAADRFVMRQIRNHLQKDPGELQASDLRKLIDWIRLAMRLISDDTKIINQYMADLNTLVSTKRPNNSHDKKATH